MLSNASDLENLINAIIERDSGTPYLEALDKYFVSPQSFYFAVTAQLNELVRFSQGRKKRVLAEIAKDEERRRELFRIDEEVLRKQYKKIKQREQTAFFTGTYLHPKNMEAIVYYALVLHNPELGTSKRENVLKAVRGLKRNLQEYFIVIGLSGLMNHLGKGKKDSPLEILKIFDRAYQERTSQPSLFDLKQEYHLHRWGPRFVYKGKYNSKVTDGIEEAIYHTLTEAVPSLASKNRSEVVEAIKNLPLGLAKYFFSLGLRGIMKRGFKKGEVNSPRAVLNVYKSAYMRGTGDISLFDKSKSPYIEFDGKKRVR